MTNLSIKLEDEFDELKLETNKAFERLKVNGHDKASSEENNKFEQRIDKKQEEIEKLISILLKREKEIKDLKEDRN